MRIQLLLSVVAAASGCKQLECANGTIERNGACEPADTSTNASMCGPFTVLQGDRCAPQFPPTVCDPATTAEDVDVSTGVITCIGTGGGGCGAALACPAGTIASKMTICGQLYDFETGQKLAESGATGAKCPATPTSSGPCALGIDAYDAIAFGTNPQTAQKLPVSSVYIDTCGRYRVSDIDTSGTGPFIGLGIDDAGIPNGPGGTTVTVGIATAKVGMGATKDLEGFVVTGATATKWAMAGGPTLTTGIYAPVYRVHKVGNGDPYAPQAGVTITKNGSPVSAKYFAPTETTRSTIDGAATATGANGTGLYNAASVADGPVYGGSGGLGAGCRWEPHAGASLPGIVFIQVFRKIDIVGMTCND